MKIMCHGRTGREFYSEEEYLFFEEQADMVSERTVWFRLFKDNENNAYPDFDGMEIDTHDEWVEQHTHGDIAFMKPEWL